MFYKDVHCPTLYLPPKLQQYLQAKPKIEATSPVMKANVSRVTTDTATIFLRFAHTVIPSMDPLSSAYNTGSKISK